MTEFDPIPAFNGKLTFPDAYTWDVTKIFDFLSKVAANPADYGAPADRKADFQQLYNYIYALRAPATQGGTGGDRYETPKPQQQILRKNQTTAALDPTAAIRWTANSISEPYFIIFDLVGVFLSLMGPAPTSGTAPTSKNYFLPLVVVYARWCRLLAKSVGFTPTIAQITWSSKDSGKTWYSFLGSSAGGFVKEQTWKDLVGKTRHDYLNAILQSSQWPNYGQSPLKDKDDKAGTNFGNCGETYPFLYILADSNLKQSSYGIALAIASTKSVTAYNGATFWQRKAMWAPCLNCQKLMELYGVGDRVKYFDLVNP